MIMMEGYHQYQAPPFVLAMSSLKIKFDKSEVMVLGYWYDEQQRIANNLNCRLSSFPLSP